ncbi:hypothetical protein AARAC_009873 [Aspergillus arachidicola]|uniref:Uncharacterized protein n=1 Tax=Aspergillus arachidicola TaxID=656916 RepID=A0A2G7G9D0_9EURO|nr:hypothetical protein AARAC_009873 [Aspergillus arachidicola]
MESEEYAPMSGSNLICTTTVLLDTGMIPMKEPVTELALDTAAGLVTVTAECEAGKCKTVEFNTVTAFVFELDYKVQVPGVGEVSVDIAYGLIEIGERIKRAVEASYTPVHPGNSEGVKVAVNTVVVSPGRFDRSPCGTSMDGDYKAVLPTVKGRGWITSFKQIVQDSTDPFPEGYRVGGQWLMAPN